MKQVQFILISSVLISFIYTDAASAMPKYDRHDWPHWKDKDSDCRNSRNETLIRDSKQPVHFKDQRRECKVRSGLWVDPYSKKVIRDSKKIDIDHIIPLKHAHESGAFQWNKEEKKEFANDPDNLLAVGASPNRIKGAKGLLKWKPHISYWCEYAKKWERLKEKYDLFMTQEEELTVQVMLETCKYKLAKVPGVN